MFVGRSYGSTILFWDLLTLSSSRLVLSFIFLQAIATVNEKASVKCVLDSPDLTPYWLNDNIAQERCNETGSEAFIDEATKDLWGRTDDESCIRELENELNDSLLASSCGMFSQYWKHVQTPMFIISSQWNEPDFNRVTCNVSQDDEDYFTYRYTLDCKKCLNVDFWLSALPISVHCTEKSWCTLEG